MPSSPPLSLSSVGGSGAARFRVDLQQPFRGIVVCCTSIPPDERSEIDKRVVQLGGRHKYDLTPDVTHLIVGDYDTPKYRHVAKERFDVIPVAAGWTQAVMDLWREDCDMDFHALESSWRLKPLESSGGSLLDPAPKRRQLVICLTGFDEPDMRQRLITQINENGGIYTGDLTRQVTHLIVRRPEGRKYMAAQKWQVKCVAAQWLEDSIRRGMILSEDCYDPLLPADKIGEGAWTKKPVEQVGIGKRRPRNSSPSMDYGTRKLRKTASMKLQSQSNDMWASILGASTPADSGADGMDNMDPTQPNPRSIRLAHEIRLRAEEPLVFSCCVFVIHGYPDHQRPIVNNVIVQLGGRICETFDEASALRDPAITYKLLVVPQSSRIETHPSPPPNFRLVTEFYLEKCLHKRKFFSPTEHVLGRPFPLFPIPKFAPLKISIGGFSDVDLQQVEKAITQLGAAFAERFTPKSHVLVCNDLFTMRQQKINLALSWQVPVVDAHWLWECIKMGCLLPLGRFLIKQLHQNANLELPVSASENSGPATTSSFSMQQGSKGRNNPDGRLERLALERTHSAPADATTKRDRYQICTTTETNARPTLSGPYTTAQEILPLNGTSTIIGSELPRNSTSPPSEKPRDDEQTKPLSITETRVQDRAKLYGRYDTSHVANSENDANRKVEAPGDLELKMAFSRSRSPRGPASPRREILILTDGTSSKGEARKHAERREIEAKLINTILADDTAPKTRPDGSKHGNSAGSAPPAPSGRKRQKGVFGRAVSNTNTITGVGAGARQQPDPPPLPPGVLFADGVTDELLEVSLIPKEPEKPPPATQVGYAVTTERKNLLSKIKGGAGTHKEDPDESQGKDVVGVKKFSEMTVGQYERMMKEERRKAAVAIDSGVGGRTGSRVTSRRTPGF